jgi:Zn-dependent protease
MDSAFNVGKIFGIQLRLHYTWFVIFTLVTLSLVFPNWSKWYDWIIGIVASLLFFASVVAHELAHSLVGKAYGVPVKSITLFIFGGIAQMTREASCPGAEFRMAAAGPVCSLVIGGLFYLILLVTPVTEPISIMIQWLAIINVALAVFNLIPGFPLDGGRVLRSFLWRTSGNYMHSTRIATQVGRGVGYLFIAGGIAIIFTQFSGLHPFGFSMNWFSGLWLVFIGWFLKNTASVGYRQAQWRGALHGVTVAQVMTSDIPAVPPGTTINQLVQEYVFLSGCHYCVVADDGRLVGIVSLQNIRSVPQQKWEVTQVRDIMTPVDKVEVAHLEQDALVVMEHMDGNSLSQIPVVSEGRVVGLVIRDSLIRFLRNRSELGI